MSATSWSNNSRAARYSRYTAASMGSTDDILSISSPVPITLVHSQSRHEYAGASGQTWRDRMPAQPPLMRNIETVSSSQSGARISINQVDSATASARPYMED